MKILFDSILNSPDYTTDIDKTISEAFDMLRGKYVFNNVWDMEPCDTPVFNKFLYLNRRFHKDREWAFMFTRFDYAYKFILAYEATGKRKFLEHGLKIIDTWSCVNIELWESYLYRLLRKYTKDHFCLSHRTLDMAILAVNITDYVLYCYENGIILKEQYQKYRQIVNVICEYVFNAESEFKKKSNWGIIENAGIIYAALRMEIDIPMDILSKRLEEKLKYQILPDGSQIESSPMYLAEILLVCLKIINFDKTVLSKEAAELVEKGCRYILSIKTPDCCIPNLGDSDKINVSDLMILSYSIFGDALFLTAVNRKISPEFIYKYHLTNDFTAGVKGEKTESESSKETLSLLNFETAGSNEYPENEYLATRLYRQILIKNPKTKMYMLCSNIPYKYSGHKHYDFMSFILYINGAELFIDGGRETYKNCDIRHMDTAPCSHNTLAVDGERFWKSLDSWSVNQETLPDMISFDEEKKSIEMGLDLGNGKVKLKRHISFENAGHIIITDSVTEGDFGFIEIFFNISADTKIDQSEDEIVLRLNGAKLHYSNTDMKETVIADGRASKRYNTFFKNKRIYIKTSKQTVRHDIVIEKY